MNSIKGEFGIDDKLSTGLQRQVDKQTPIHPIQMSERHYHKNQEKALAENMRKVQGLHAPLKMMYEKKAVSRVGHFPCISNRSNFQLDILEGNDDIISFNDVLGRPEDYEGMAHPHDVIDKSLAPLKM
eukprot:08375.XXX_306364_306747_1 [CDS] Oithona nana genome sequencing.